MFGLLVVLGYGIHPLNTLTNDMLSTAGIKIINANRFAFWYI